MTLFLISFLLLKYNISFSISFLPKAANPLLFFKSISSSPLAQPTTGDRHTRPSSSFLPRSGSDEPPWLSASSPATASPNPALPSLANACRPMDLLRPLLLSVSHAVSRAVRRRARESMADPVVIYGRRSHPHRQHLSLSSGGSSDLLPYRRRAADLRLLSLYHEIRWISDPSSSPSQVFVAPSTHGASSLGEVPCIRHWRREQPATSISSSDRFQLFSPPLSNCRPHLGLEHRRAFASDSDLQSRALDPWQIPVARRPVSPSSSSSDHLKSSSRCKSPRRSSDRPEFDGAATCMVLEPLLLPLQIRSPVFSARRDPKSRAKI